MDDKTLTEFMLALPESNFIIYSDEICLEDLSDIEIITYNALVHDHLMKVDKEYREHFEGKETPVNYVIEIGSDREKFSFFTDEILANNLVCLRADHYPTMTDQQILKMIEDELYLDEHIGY